MNPPGNLTSLTNIQSQTTSSAPYDQFDDVSWNSETPNFNEMESDHQTQPPITNTPDAQSNSQFPITFPSDVTGEKGDDNPTDLPHFTISPGIITDSTLTAAPTKLIKSPAATLSPVSVAKRANNGKMAVGRGGSGKTRVKIKKSGGRASTTTTMESHKDNMTGYSLPLEMKSLADLDHPEHLNVEISEGRKIKSNRTLFTESTIKKGRFMILVRLFLRYVSIYRSYTYMYISIHMYNYSKYKCR